jgi:uncharacterized membrane protein
MILATVAAEASGENFTPLMDHVAQGFEALGAAILVVGVIWSFVLAAVAARRFGWSAKAYLVLRQVFGGTLLFGLEVLVAADLIRTVAVSPTLDSVLVLGLIACQDLSFRRCRHPGRQAVRGACHTLPGPLRA